MSSDTRLPGLQPWQFLAFEMVLDPRSADRRRLDEARAEMRQQGINVTNLADALERDSLAADQVYALHNECHGRQPPAGVPRARIPFHLWVWGSIESSGEALPEAYFLAMDGERYAGLSSVVRVPRLPGVLQSRFTGVRESYERRGIARGLKSEAISYAAEHGYAQLRSTVLADNVAMLQVNESLGFVRRRQFVQSYPQLLTPKVFGA